MQRHPSLQTLSREHHSALTLAKKCQRAAQSDDAKLIALACQQVLADYDQSLKPHFDYEETVLLPLLNTPADEPLRQQTLADHRDLGAMLSALRHNSAPVLARFGTRLIEHVRFEERVLFQRLEALL